MSLTPPVPRHSVLIVGCGSIGERHARCFRQTGRAAVAVHETNPQRAAHMATRYGLPITPDLAAGLAAGQFSSAVICTPAPLHVPLAIQCLEAGLHVLIEKPLSHSLTDIDRLQAVHACSNRHVAVAYVYHVYPFLRQARSFLQAGHFGPVLQVAVLSGHPFHLLRPAYATTYFRDRATGGGAVQDALTHLANWIESVVGPTDSVLCDCDHLALANVEVEDAVHVAARHGKTLVSYALNQFQAANESTIQFNAAGGSVKIEFHRQRWGTLAAGDTDWTWHECPVPERDSHFVAQANAFLDEVEGRPPILCSLTAGTATLRFNLACLAAAQSDRRVSCTAIPLPHE